MKKEEDSMKKPEMMEKPESFVHIHDSRVVNATKDGMELLGHFLVTQVGTKADFFIKWTKEDADGDISAGSYFLIKRIGRNPVPRIAAPETIEIEHLNDESIPSFITSRKNFLEILQKWQGVCKSDDSHSACNAGSMGIKIIRSMNGETFTFETQK